MGRIDPFDWTLMAFDPRLEPADLVALQIHLREKYDERSQLGRRGFGSNEQRLCCW
jgi:hypothetical protein